MSYPSVLSSKSATEFDSSKCQPSPFFEQASLKWICSPCSSAGYTDSMGKKKTNSRGKENHYIILISF